MPYTQCFLEGTGPCPSIGVEVSLGPKATQSETYYFLKVISIGFIHFVKSGNLKFRWVIGLVDKMSD